MTGITLRVRVSRLGRGGQQVDSAGFAPSVLSEGCRAIRLDLLPRWRDGLQLADGGRRRRRIPGSQPLRRPLAVVHTSIVRGLCRLRHVAIRLGRRRVLLAMAVRSSLAGGFPTLGLDARRVTGWSVQRSVGGRGSQRIRVGKHMVWRRGLEHNRNVELGDVAGENSVRLSFGGEKLTSTDSWRFTEHSDRVCT